MEDQQEALEAETAGVLLEVAQAVVLLEGLAAAKEEDQQEVELEAALRVVGGNFGGGSAGGGPGGGATGGIAGRGGSQGGSSATARNGGAALTSGNLNLNLKPDINIL